MDFFVGVLAMFVAILVTSPIIPHTFETGSVELLLSKPISRSLLFLAKFVGGCAFILLNATYLIVGLWLIAGLRFDVWEHKLLLCIPIFMFLFMVYYSVSALAGLIWHSAIVSVVVTLVFWAVCFSVGLTKTGIERVMLTPNRIVSIIPARDVSLTVNESNRVHQWDRDKQEWEAVYESTRSPAFFTGPFRIRSRRMLGPVYDSQADLLLSADLPWNGRGGTSDGASLEAGLAQRQWARFPVADMPDGSVGLYTDAQGDVLAVARKGVFRLPADRIQLDQRGEDDHFFVDLPDFEIVFAGKDLKSWAPRNAAFDPDSEDLAVWTGERLVVLRRDGVGNYELAAEREISAEDESIALALAGGTILLARPSGEIWVLGSDSLETRSKLQPEGQSQPRFVEAAPGGQWFAIVLHNGDLWLYDSETERLYQPDVTGQGDISAAAFDGANHLLVADRTVRVSRYELASLKLEKQLAPNMDLLEKIYRYVAVPVYTVFPRPGELSDTVKYVLTEQETSGRDVEVKDLARPQVKIDPWGPVYSSLGFMVVVLAVSCWYLHRAEF
jgi:hypothetical protein